MSLLIDALSIVRELEQLGLSPELVEGHARIQAQFQATSDQPFELLTKIGKECVGAIQLCNEIPDFMKQINVKYVSDSDIANLLQNYWQAPLGMQRNDESFRISIAGAQHKTAFLFYKNRWCRPQGVTPTSHIFKLPIGVIPHQQIDLSDSCENEWLCSQIAMAYGFEVAACQIKTFEEVKVLAVERFDRRWSTDHEWLIRLPQEDLCQALGYSPNLKYEAEGGPGIAQIMKFLLGSHNAAHDREQFFRAQILFYLLAAIDGHAKNFSVFIKAKGRYQLTPLYDIMSAHPLLMSKQLQLKKIKMAMALQGKNRHYHWSKIQHRHFLTTAKAAHFSMRRAELLLNQMLDQLDDVIKKVSNQIPRDFPSVITESIFNGMKKAREQLL